MNTTVLNEIMAFLFGRKYYANIVRTNGTTREELCSYIFPTKEQAEKHKRDLQHNMSYKYVETIHFRSRNVYSCTR